MPILEARQLTKTYRSGSQQVKALQGVDLTVQPGEFVAIVGPSGCGKSTLLYLIGGIEAATSGVVLLEGEPLGQMNDDQRSVMRRRRLGFVFQKINLLPTLSARENVALPLMIDGVGKAAASDRAQEMLSSLGMSHRATHYPADMSGGEQQRVAIARALVTNPAVVLADEPTGALDSANSRKIVDIMHSLSQAGQAVVIVTHDMQVAARADRIIRMRDGRIDQDESSLGDAIPSATMSEESGGG